MVFVYGSNGGSISRDGGNISGNVRGDCDGMMVAVDGQDSHLREPGRGLR